MGHPKIVRWGPDESRLEGDHLVVECSLCGNKIYSHALTDCGATGFALADEQFVASCPPRPRSNR